MRRSSQNLAVDEVEQTLQDARESLLSYCLAQNEHYETPDHLCKIASYLEAVERGEIKRLIITLPPRHGKSNLASQFFPAWYIGRNPDKFIITATYGQDLASDFGRKVRNQIIDPFYQAIFPRIILKDDSTAANRFATTHGGEYFAVGVGGPVTGRGAHVLLIDDSCKNREEADSQQIREKTNEWYSSTAYTRLMPSGAVVIVQTRWHEDDLVGHILKNHGHENWVVINLPAIKNENTKQEAALWSERYPLEVLKTIRSTLIPYDWHCLYQQNPIPKEGNIIKAEWLKSGFADEYAAMFMAIDPAISKKETADKTAFSVWGIGYGKSPNLYEIETPYGRYDLQEILTIGRSLFEKYKDKMVLFGVENVAFQKVLGDEFARMGLPCVQLAADGDKVRRLMSVTHFFSQGRVYVNSPELRKQLLRFRGIDGDEDDLVDAAVHCLRLIRSNSMDRYEKKEDRYKGLDPRSRAFWEGHFKQKENDSNVGKNLNQFYGL